MLVFIGIASGGTVQTETVANLFPALKTLADNNIEYAIAFQNGGYKPFNVNYLIKTAQEAGASHYMSIDCDMVFPHSGILRLLDSDKDIIGANYNQRYTPQYNERLATIKLSDDKGGFINVNADDVPRTMFKCAALGLGFTLIKMSVFDKLDKPYFNTYESPETGEFHTEDIEFCIKATKAGFDIWCNPTISMGHIGHAVA